MTAVTNEERSELLAGLSAHPPRVSPRYFYDEVGSRLFDRITRTPEYYPTRTELAILRDRGGAIGERISAGSVIVELGSGSADKILALLAHLDAPRLYRPIDISRAALDKTCEGVRRGAPDLDVSPFEGDFTAAAAYADLPAGAPKLVYYSGSTIGNFEPAEATAFLRALRERLAPGDVLLLAADLVKDHAVLHAAYNDAAGVTAAFNRNMLRHLNARFGTDFDAEAFDHLAFFEPKKRRIEMHLVPRSEQRVRIGDETVSFTKPIHTESSYKFTPDDLTGLARASGFVLETIVTDDRGWFAEAIFRA
ncbi:MAG: L-histidine N(alpha)-methyltransferase [Polyangiaceae bacterium]|nr:L-histidine N(alpha)-methyltransferase [Polyangiaceae bacterium]